MEIAEFIYYVYFAIMIGVRSFGIIEGMTVYNISLIVGMLLFVIKVLMTEHSLLEYMVGAVLFGIAGIVYVFSGEKGMLLYFTMIFGAKAIKVSRAYIAGLISVGLGLITLRISSLTGIIEESYYLQERSQGLVFRHSLGYPHPNSLQMTCTVWCMMLIYVALKKGKKYFFSASVISIILSGYIYTYSNSRTGLLSICIFVFLNAYFILRKNVSPFEKFFIQLIFPMGLLIGVVGPLLPKLEFMNNLDRNILSRFEISSAYLEENGIALFGQRLVTPEKYLYGNYGIDMGYSYLFIQLGIVMTILVAVLFIWFINYLLKKDRYIELSVMLTMVIIGYTESYIFNLGYKNIAYMLMGSAIFEFIREKCSEMRMASIKINPIKIRYRIKNSLIKISVISEAFAFPKAIGIMGLSITAAIMGVVIYLALNPVPSAIYSPVNYTERQELKMEATFLTREDVSTIISGGDVVVDYKDETTPMYKYGQSTALWHHIEKTADIFVLVYLIATVLYIIFYGFKTKKE
ncbi:MAG: hypothetical protein K6A23_03680 [Butyrivibrio sp.]|nr:hypothetical protein [Butyrivibrio sp.]